ncbi:MAG: hypothetical protein ACAH17_03375 [Candidatus Paceibacterota bacterium]
MSASSDQSQPIYVENEFDMQWMIDFNEEELPSQQTSIPSTNPSTFTRQPAKEFKVLPPKNLAQRIIWGETDDEGMIQLKDLFKRETKDVLQLVIDKLNRHRAKKQQTLLSIDNLPNQLPLLEELFDLFFYDLAVLLTHRDHEIFEGSSDADQRNEFANFLADLNIYSVTRNVLSDFNNISLQPYVRTLPLSLSPIRFNRILQKIDSVVEGNHELLQNLENCFTTVNSKHFYNRNLFLGIDDDKPRIKGTEKVGLPAKPGRGTHTYSRVHEAALVSSTLTIGRSSQRFGESDRVSAERVFSQIRLSSAMHSETHLPNLFLADRGYSCLLRSLRYSFGTLKTGRQTGNIFILDKFSPEEKKNFYYVSTEGAQTLYGAITDRRKTDGSIHPEVQVAFGGGTGQITCLIVPHPGIASTAPFNSDSIGTWFGVANSGAKQARKLTQVYPENALDPEETLSEINSLRFLSSSQNNDVFWHVARFGLAWTSRSMSSAFKNLVVARKELNVRYQDLFVLLGFENFLPVESTSAGPTVASYINSFTDNKSLWQRIKALNLEIPLLNAQGGREPGKFVSGRVGLEKMKISTIRFLELDPALFQRLSNTSLDAILLPDILANMALPPIQAREHQNFIRGRENEPRMTSELPRFLEEWSNGKYKVLRCYTVGLVTTPYSLAIGAGSSPDLVVVLQETASGRTFSAIVEYKTATTDATRESLLVEARGLRFIEAELNSNSFPLLVPDKEHRPQVLHHACTLRIPCILYIRGLWQDGHLHSSVSDTSMQLISLIFVPGTIIDSYNSLMTELFTELNLQQLFTSLKNQPDPPPNRLIELGLFDVNGRASSRLLHIRDTHTLGLNLKLGELVQQLPHPPPPCRKLLPQVCCLWNYYKGFSDVSSRPKEDFKLCFNKGAGSKLVCRLLASQMLNVAKLYNLFCSFNQIQLADNLGTIRDLLNARHDPTKSLRIFLLTSYTSLRNLFLFPNAAGESSLVEGDETGEDVTPKKGLASNTHLANARGYYQNSRKRPRMPGHSLSEAHYPDFKRSKKKKACVECKGTLDGLPGGRPHRTGSYTKKVATPVTTGRCKACRVPIHAATSKKFPNCHKHFHLRVVGEMGPYPTPKRHQTAASHELLSRSDLSQNIAPLIPTTSSCDSIGDSQMSARASPQSLGSRAEDDLLTGD